MPRWKELPTELDPRVRQLVVRLRRLKDHSGLTMRQLAAKTGYSAKSWERYLGGKALPPREAVEAMARIEGGDPTRLLALHEVATEAWGDRRGAASAPKATGTGEAAQATAAAAVPGSPPAGPNGTKWTRLRVPSSRLGLVAGAVTLVVAVSTAVLVVVRPTDGAGRPSADTLTPSAAAASSSRSKPTYTCQVERIDGRWYAGNSRTQDALLAYGHAGPKVAEAQCLLRRAGISPGKIDGIYGPLTQRAVKIIQSGRGCPRTASSARIPGKPSASARRPGKPPRVDRRRDTE